MLSFGGGIYRRMHLAIRWVMSTMSRLGHALWTGKGPSYRFHLSLLILSLPWRLSTVRHWPLGWRHFRWKQPAWRPWHALLKLSPWRGTHAWPLLPWVP